ncbi:MAG TPA: hypothetical protein VHZ97_18150 [Pseudonocardiaceae bacterium]|jgi:hypothetical protein|nr:hypothetical protein [Pseudonocardiaceae bacterium]
MTTIASPIKIGTAFAATAPARDRAPVAPVVGHALVTAGKFVGNFAVALTLAVLLGADADL